MLGILLRFREGKYAVTGDIQEMSHRIAIRKQDQDSQRFLFRHKDNERLDVYVMQVMTFGATCSPACAQYVKNHNANLHEDRFPEASKAIVKSHYVDNYLDSYDCLEQASKLVSDIIKIHEIGNFRMRDFVSNSGKLTETIPKDRLSDSNDIALGQADNAYEKILGIIWDFRKDVIKYNLKLPQDIPLKFTKRNVLSIAMSVYDPLGLISNITIESRILMQELWKMGLDWDEPLPQRLR